MRNGQTLLSVFVDGEGEGEEEEQRKQEEYAMRRCVVVLFVRCQIAQRCLILADSPSGRNTIRCTQSCHQIAEGTALSRSVSPSTTERFDAVQVY